MAGVYTPVNWNPLKPPAEFRLIDLSGGNGEEDLKCTLVNVTFEKAAGIYIALSYAWGGQEVTETIICNGYVVRITRSLHSALRRLRQPQKTIAFWCDALCIKQGTDPASLLERSQQIPLMERIFTSAVRVVIDLGDDDGTLDQAVAGVNAILRTPQNERLQARFTPDPIGYLKLPDYTDPMWSALRHFLSRP